MKTPKPITALKALLLGADIKLPDGYTYRYDKGDEKQGPCLCIVARMSNELGNYEDCTIGSDLSLQQFIQLCEQMTEEQWVAICATCALTLERIERDERRGRRHAQQEPAVCDALKFGCDPECRREVCPIQETRRVLLPRSPKPAVPDEATQQWKELCVDHLKKQSGLAPCQFDKDGQCKHEARLQNMPCHRQNCPWPERQTGLGSDIWWKGRPGDQEKKS